MLNWIPPVFATVRINRLWLPVPVVLFWPLLLLGWLVLGLVWMVVPARQAVGLSRGRRLVALARAWCLMGALRGLRVDVRPARRAGAAAEVASPAVVAPPSGDTRLAPAGPASVPRHGSARDMPRIGIRVV